jgi:hypothetical protein
MGPTSKLLANNSFAHADILGPNYSKKSTRNITIIIIKIVMVNVIIKIRCKEYLLYFSTLELEKFAWTSLRLFALLYRPWEFWSNFSFFFLFLFADVSQYPSLKLGRWPTATFDFVFFVYGRILLEK